MFAALIVALVLSLSSGSSAPPAATLTSHAHLTPQRDCGLQPVCD
jgi:hypothetical protein